MGIIASFLLHGSWLVPLSRFGFLEKQSEPISHPSLNLTLHPTPETYNATTETIDTSLDSLHLLIGLSTNYKPRLDLAMPRATESKKEVGDVKPYDSTSNASPKKLVMTKWSRESKMSILRDIISASAPNWEEIAKKHEGRT